MHIITVSDNISREELFERVRAELDTMRPHSRALVLLEDKTIRDKRDISAGTHTIRCMPIKRTLPVALRGQRADIIAVERAENITIDGLITLSAILHDRSEDTGVLICPRMMSSLPWADNAKGPAMHI